MNLIPQRTSLVAQVVDILRQELAHGRWKDYLPGQRSLCDSLQVSRFTLEQALGNPLVVVGTGTTAGGSFAPEVVLRTHNPLTNQHSAIAVDAATGRDAILFLAENGEAIWDVRHLGPTAQEFHAAFGLGADDRHISTTDADGVALAAIQGLYEVVKEKDARIGELEKRLAELERKLATGGK